jgi:phosphoglycerate dehydrogenase-like enzyme
MLIAIFDERLDPARLTGFGEHEVRIVDTRGLSAAGFAQAAREAVAVATRRIPGWEFDRALVESLPKLQFLHKGSTGLDWMDLAALSEHGVLVANNEGFNAAAVSDHVVLVAQLALKGTYEKITQMRNGIWNRDQPPGGAITIGGRTVGIIGLGRIGTNAGRRFAAAGAQIVAHGRHPREEPTIPGGVRWLPLDDLLRESDVVAVCVPLTPETDRLIGARELALMKPSAVLVNVSRGRVVDEQALYDALAGGRLRAAGLDVWEEEPTPMDNPLLKLPNVYGTPHVSGHGTDQHSGVLENLRLFASGQRPLRVVNSEILTDGRARAKHLCEGTAVAGGG